MTDFKAIVEYTDANELRIALDATNVLIAISRLRERIRNDSKYCGKESWTHEDLIKLCDEIFEYEDKLV